MRVLILIGGLMLASGANAAPADSINPMHLPNAGGYMQPGNPNRGISAVGPESALMRSAKSDCGKGERRKACVADRQASSKRKRG